MGDMLLLKNKDQFESIYVNAHYLLQTQHILTAAPEVWLILKTKGIEAIKASDFLVTKSQLNMVLETAKEVSSSWYKPFEHLVQYRGINLAEISRVENLTFFRELISSDLVVPQILDCFSPNRIFMFSNPNIPCISDHRFDGTHDVFEAVLLKHCRDRKILVISLDKLLYKKTKYVNVLKEIVRALIKQGGSSPNELDSLAKFKPSNLGYHTKNFIGCMRRISIFEKSVIPKAMRYLGRGTKHYLNVNSLPINSQAKTILAFCSSINIFTIMRNLAFIKNDPYYNLVVVNRLYHVPSAQYRSGFTVNNLEMFISLMDFSSGTRRHSQTLKKLSKARQIFLSHTYDNAILNNPLLQFHFDFLWKHVWVSLLSNIDRIKAAIISLRPNLVVTAANATSFDRAVIQLSHQMNISTASFPHGIVGDIDEYNFESDKFFAWGNLSKRQLVAEFEKDPKTISVTGAPHLQSSQKSMSQACKESRRRQFNLRFKAPVVLMLTAPFSSGVFNGLDMEKFWSTWEYMLLQGNSHKNIEWVIKPHPFKDYHTFYDSICKKSIHNNIRTLEGALEDILPVTSVVLLMNILTTGGLVAMENRKPLVSVQTAFMHVSRTASAWSKENGLLVAERNSEIIQLVDGLINDMAFRQQTINRQTKFLKESIAAFDPGVLKNEIRMLVDN